MSNPFAGAFYLTQRIKVPGGIDMTQQATRIRQFLMIIGNQSRLVLGRNNESTVKHRTKMC